MKLNKTALFLIFLTSVIAQLSSQERTEARLTKKDAISQMLENNFGIKLANNQVTVAKNNKSILNADFLPSLTGNAGGSFDRTSSVTDFNGATDNQGNIRPDIEIPNAETTQYNASINLDYTLFDGLGRYYNYKQLQEEYNLSKLQARETIENTILQLFSVYYEVARLTENELVLKQALEITKDREKRATYQFEYGQANKLAILNAKVDVTTDSINVLNAQQQLRNTKRDLNVVLNRALGEMAEVDTTVVFVNELVVDSFLERATTNNVRLQQVDQDIKISEYAIKSAKSFILPTVGLTGSYGWNRSENPASAFFPGTTRTSDGFNVGLNLRWNLFDGGRSIVALKNVKIANESQQLLKSQLQQQVFRDIENAKDSYKNALTIYRLQEQNVVTSKDNFDRSSERFKLGQITSVEYRQAQLNFLNAQTTKNAAKYTAKLAELVVLQLSGQLLNVDF